MGRAIEQQLEHAGYHLIGSKNIQPLLLDILRSTNERYWKAFPLLVFLHDPDLESLSNKTKNKKLLGELITITRSIFHSNGIRRDLAPLDKKTNLDIEEFNQDFILQRRRLERAPLLIDKERIYAERSLQYWMGKMFTAAERNILFHLLNGEELTKTQKEYYSRKTKKKLQGILHLQELAKSLLPVNAS